MNMAVSNLSVTVQEKDLKRIFSRYGDVASATIVNDSATGRSRGYGFVEMVDERAANKAIDGLNGARIDGRSIKVVEARPTEGSPLRNDVVRFGDRLW